MIALFAGIIGALSAFLGAELSPQPESPLRAIVKVNRVSPLSPSAFTASYSALSMTRSADNPRKPSPMPSWIRASDGNSWICTANR